MYFARTKRVKAARSWHNLPSPTVKDEMMAMQVNSLKHEAGAAHEKVRRDLHGTSKQATRQTPPSMQKETKLDNIIRYYL